MIQTDSLAHSFPRHFLCDLRFRIASGAEIAASALGDFRDHVHVLPMYSPRAIRLTDYSVVKEDDCWLDDVTESESTATHPDAD